MCAYGTVWCGHAAVSFVSRFPFVAHRHFLQEPHMNKSKLSSLLAALETGADLLKPTEEFWLRKKAPAKST
jgi:hypothetical protein